MKKILSLCIAALMLLSAVPMAMAADVDVSEGTTIKLVGSQESAGESYTVTVPAELQPGQSGTVSASGNWASNQTLTVTCPDSVTLTYGDQTMDVGINFAGINQLGNDTAASTAEANISVDDASVLFGTWTGVLEYTVSCSTDTATILHMTIDGVDYMFEEGMTWAEWAESEYDTNDEWTYMEFTSIDMCRIHSSLPGSGVIVRYNQAPLNGSEPIIAGAEYNCYDPAD